MSHSAGRSQSTALSVPPVSGSALDPFLGKHSPADEQGSDSDSGEASLEDLNNDLAYLRGRIEAVSKQRIKLLALLAPMNERPIELLMRTFKLGAYGDLLFSPTVDDVCCHWHSLARKTTAIWGNIVLKSLWTHGIEAFHRLVNQCLSRSCTSPILAGPDFYRIETVEEGHGVSNATRPHIARCSSSATSVPQPEWIELVWQHFGGQISARMEIMALRHQPASPWAAAYVQSTTLQGTMPLLHTLTLEDLPLKVPTIRSLGVKECAGFDVATMEELGTRCRTVSYLPPRPGSFYSARIVQASAYTPCRPVAYATLPGQHNSRHSQAPRCSIAVMSIYLMSVVATWLNAAGRFAKHTPFYLGLLFLLSTALRATPTSASFTHEASYRFDRIELSRIGAWCWRPGPETLPPRTCVEPALSSALEAHVENKQGTGLSIQYFDGSDSSALGGASWASWNDTPLPVVLCLSGRVEGVDGQIYRTTCYFSSEDNNFESRAAHATECTVNKPQRRVTDGCYDPPETKDFNLSAHATSILTVSGFILGALSCSFFAWLGRWFWRRLLGTNHRAQAGDSANAHLLTGSSISPSTASTPSPSSPAPSTSI